jgi:hypothetical protein
MKDMEITEDKKKGPIMGWLSFVMIGVPVMITFITLGR